MSGETKPAGIKIDTVLGIAAVIFLLGIFWYVTSNSKQLLRRSPSGLDGLGILLKTPDGPDVRSFSGGWRQNPDNVGLRILPIYDHALFLSKKTAKSKEDLLAQMTEYDQTVRVLQEKAEIVPTMFVLPKWRSGMRLTGLAHPELLIPAKNIQTALQQVFETDAKVKRKEEPFGTFEATLGDDPGRVAQLYAPQVFVQEGCEALIGSAEGIVLGRCSFPEAPNKSVLVLSDPDLINNHGLRLGNNAQIMRDFLLAEADQKTILIDYSTNIWLYRPIEGVKRERTWDDLLQFFAYPFSLLWASGGILMALVLWRAGLQYGPLAKTAQSIGASKLVANAARARLMRLTGQDGAVLHDYAQTRLAAYAARHLGPAAARDPHAALKFMRRKRPELAERLEDAMSNIAALPAYHPPELVLQHVDTFEHILEQLDHDT